MNRRFGIFCLALVSMAIALADDGPTPLFHWSFQEKFQTETHLDAQRGPAIALEKKKTLNTPRGLALLERQKTSAVNANSLELPRKDITVSAWFSVHEPLVYGGIVGAQEDNGRDE